MDLRDKMIAYDELHVGGLDYKVSTKELVPNKKYETQVDVRNGCYLYQRKYNSREDAEAGHKKIVEAVKNGEIRSENDYKFYRESFT